MNLLLVLLGLPAWKGNTNKPLFWHFGLQVSAADLYMQAQIALQYDDIDGAKKALK